MTFFIAFSNFGHRAPQRYTNRISDCFFYWELFTNEVDFVYMTGFFEHAFKNHDFWLQLGSLLNKKYCILKYQCNQVIDQLIGDLHKKFANKNVLPDESYTRSREPHIQKRKKIIKF